MTLVQHYLDMFGLDALVKQFSIKVARHPDYPNLVHLRYDMINSPMGDPIVQECRGIIVDENNCWDVVARPFDKFFNYGEGYAATIDWSTARVQAKLDGSIMYLYYYADKWHVSTSGRPAADGAVNNNTGTFADLFWDVWLRDMKWSTPGGDFSPNITYIFELTAPENRVVVPHVDRKLTLIGVRDRRDGREWPTTNFGPGGYGLTSPFLNPVKEYPLASLDDAIATFATLKPLMNEGYVIVDAKWNRIKVKHPGYVAIHHAKDSVGTSTRAIVEIVRSGEMDEVLSYFPELRTAYDLEHMKWTQLIARVHADYEAHKHHAVQKEFALAIKSLPWSAPLFALRAGKIQTADAWLRQAPVDTVLRLMECV